MQTQIGKELGYLNENSPIRSNQETAEFIFSKAGQDKKIDILWELTEIEYCKIKKLV